LNALLVVIFVIQYFAYLLTDCPTPWVEYGNACYMFDLFPTTMTDAKQSCAVSILAFSFVFAFHIGLETDMAEGSGMAQWSKCYEF